MDASIELSLGCIHSDQIVSVDIVVVPFAELYANCVVYEPIPLNHANCDLSFNYNNTAA